MERHTNIPAVYLILKKNNQLLLVCRKNTGYEDGNFSLVSGHLEKGESFTQAMIRETKEEVGIDIDSASLKVVHVMHRLSLKENTSRVDVFFAASSWMGDIENLEPDKCSELAWFEFDDFPANTVPCVRQAILAFSNKSFYSEYGWN